MTTDPAFLDALDALVEAQNGVLDALRNLRDAAAGVDPDNPPPSGELAPPDGFTAIYDPATRRVTCRWTPQPDVVERHERLHPPHDTTLRAVVPGDYGESTSSELAGGTYEWALRSRRGDAVSAFTEWRRTVVPGKGAQPPAGDEPDDEDPPRGDVDGTPVDVLPELATWTVMLPRLKPDGDSPQNDYASRWGNVDGLFYAAEVLDDPAVVFRCPAEGATSPNSKYPRVEARQMADAAWTKAAWSSSGLHTLRCELALDTRNLSTRKRISGMQIHDGGDDVCQLIYDARDGLGLSYDDGDSWQVIDGAYLPGTRFTCEIVAERDRVTVWYDGRPRAEFSKRGTGWYFKVGAYLQTGGKSEHREPPGAYGEVIVWSLTTTGGAR